MADKKFPTDYTDEITIPDTNDKLIITDNSVGEALKQIKWSNLRLANTILDTIIKTADYTILDTDSEDVFIGNPNTASQYGLLTITAPATGSNFIKKRRIEHGTNQGLVRVDANGSQKFNFKDNDLQYILLYNPGDFVEFYWNTNTSKWSIKSLYAHFNTGFLNCSDWSNRHFGNEFDYDNKSASIDFTGMILTEEISSNTFVVLEDTGGTGSSGTIKYYNATGTGIVTNNRELTASDSTTADVNEPSGTNKNLDANFHHNFGYNKVDTKFYISSTATPSGMQLLASHVSSDTNKYGAIIWNIDNTEFKIQSCTNGILLTNDDGTQFILDTEDYYRNHFCEFKV